MNSSQINFFLAPTDWPLVIEFISTRNMKWIAEKMVNPQELIFKDIKECRVLGPKIILLANPEFNNIFLKYSDRRNVYDVAIDESYVIQFSPSGFFSKKPNRLERGRFYCVNGYFVENGEKVEKSLAFRDWVKKFFKDFKKEFLVKFGDRNLVFVSRNILRLMDERKGTIDPGCLSIEFGE